MKNITLPKSLNNLLVNIFMVEADTYKKLKEQVKKINTERDETITKAYIVFRDIQRKAKLDAKTKILELDETLKKSKK